MKNKVFRIAALTLALMMLISNAGMLLQAEAISSKRKKDKEETKQETQENDWLNNIMTSEPIDAFEIKKEKIYSVTFLDNLDDVPVKAWNMGRGASSRVKGWIEWNGGMADVYFAAKGGINGELSCRDLFEDCENLEEINFNGAFHTEKAECMDKMFYNCLSLEEIDLSTIDTSSVTSMSEMFRNCQSLEELNVENFNTENVTSMYAMFSTCTSLEELDLSNFDTAKVTNMGFMFSACRSLIEADVTSFDTSKVTNMEGMFRWCDSLEYLDVTGWNMKRVKTYTNFMDPGIYYDEKPWENIFK